MALKNSVPRSLRGPVGLLSIVVALLGVIIGYIYVLFGISLYFKLIPQMESTMSTGESLIVLVTGIVFFVIGYAGWRGFNYFAY
ncbi:hypothetical protein SAMN05421858_1185 [Haladaptatus litoreus]|uniref:Uncharacterized protein n=1 Tax=Haladaptatus litoreus TaxID=553468 RepID=A0A1N6XLM0_9EURY|nr:hypothetical protein [Haladaptatus litoreus]SIR03276.1 hypothetical protein SAMN05421858_1185 [Haladaptatus litoreus]